MTLYHEVVHQLRPATSKGASMSTSLRSFPLTLPRNGIIVSLVPWAAAVYFCLGGMAFYKCRGTWSCLRCNYESLEEASKVNILKSFHSHIAGALNRYKYKMQQKPLGTLGQI